MLNHCQDDLLAYCSEGHIDAKKPVIEFFSRKDILWICDPDYQEGSSTWYGINNFFKWVEKKTYKMHIRVFLQSTEVILNAQHARGKIGEEPLVEMERKVSS